MTVSVSTGFSPSETARYTLDMLESLRRIAAQQNQGMLAHLLELAAAEARIQAAGQETALPG